MHISFLFIFCFWIQIIYMVRYIHCNHRKVIEIDRVIIIMNRNDIKWLYYVKRVSLHNWMKMNLPSYARCWTTTVWLTVAFLYYLVLKKYVTISTKVKETYRCKDKTVEKWQSWRTSYFSCHVVFLK